MRIDPGTVIRYAFAHTDTIGWVAAGAAGIVAWAAKRMRDWNRALAAPGAGTRPATRAASAPVAPVTVSAPAPVNPGARNRSVAVPPKPAAGLPPARAAAPRSALAAALADGAHARSAIVIAEVLAPPVSLR